MTAFPKPAPRQKERRPLKRKTWMRRRAPRRLSRAGSDPAYLASVRMLPCAVASVRCSGPIHAHHAIHRSQGGKDQDAVPLCMVDHKHWHEGTGPFSRWSKMERFAWAVQAIAITREAVATQRKGTP